MGPRTDSSCCCQARNLCMGPCTAILMLLPGPECVMGPLYGLHCCCPIATLCHVPLFRSPHTAGGFHFCHRVL
ncbi:unnamed protein product [Staurois parvus]|uniref:Beta-defensin n=1 Tax=Staurois parvus TaxID=386267 RepID=A0ABN9G8K5_9NEOB|nr:unnamed protein product [Staurois parvus]